MRVNFSDLRSHIWCTCVHFGTECTKNTLEARLPGVGTSTWYNIQHCIEMPTLMPKAVELLAQNYDWTNTPHCSVKLIHSDLRHPDTAIIAPGYTTSTAGALFGISALCSTVHHRHSSSLSKLHLTTDYHNLELRLHSLKTLQSLVIHRIQILTSVLQLECSWAQTSTL